MPGRSALHTTIEKETVAVIPNPVDVSEVRPVKVKTPLGPRLIARMRLLLAFSALAILYVDPAEPTRFVALTYGSLFAYCVWAAYQYRATPASSLVQSAWFDVAWAACLVALAPGNGATFLFIFFAIVVGAFSGGYRRGMAMTFASTLIFILAGALGGLHAPQFGLGGLLTGSVYLLCFGWILSAWGGHEIEVRRRLALLRQIAADWNPRLGTEWIVQANLLHLRDFYDAADCILVLQPTWRGESCTTFTALEGASKAPSAKYAGPAAALLMRNSVANGVARRHQDPSVRQATCDLFGTAHFAVVPFVQPDGTRGLLFVARDQPLGQDDEGFLEQVAQAMAHAVENARLIEELFRKAAEHERFRISLDIHDSTVQPYIGLKLGLDALSRQAEGSPLASPIADLLEMANDTIRSLRGFASGIRERAPISGESLLQAVREQTERFRRFYGLDVAIECDESLFVSSHIASEAFRMISEGLSNVMKHTAAKEARIRITCVANELQLVIENGPWGHGVSPANFTPKSINARAVALHGTSFVEAGAGGRSAVHVTVPL